MERDPILFAWRSAPRQHMAAAGLAVGLGLPLALLGLLCLRDLVGALTQVGGTDPLPFLKLTLPLPGDGTVQPLPLFSGWPMAQTDLYMSALIGLAVSAIGVAGLAWAVALLGFAAQTRAAGRLRATVTEAILRAPAAAREDVRGLPSLVGRALAGMGGLPAMGIVLPVLTVAALVLALAMAELAAPRLVPVVAVALLAIGLARVLLLRRNASRAALRRSETAAAEDVLGDLIRRMPAVRAHGAAAFERRRLGLRSLAARATLSQAERALAYARAPAFALVVLLPAILIATALWQGDEPAEIDRLLPGALAAAAGALGVAAVLVGLSLRLLALHTEVAPTFRAIAATLAGLDARRPASASRRPPPFPEGGELKAEGLGAYDPSSGERLAGVDLSLSMPAHVAIVGGRGGGVRALAAVLAGQIEPTAGHVSYGGHDLRALDPAERARRIAFAGSEAILIEGTLRQNLLYGARSLEREASGQAERIEILKLTGLDAFVYDRGLEASVDPEDEPALAAALVEARRAVRARLAEEGMGRLVEPFDPDRYNHQASVGENILFGEAVAPAFSEARIAAHPYLRAVLEAEGLTQPLLEVGLQVARSTVEIFSDLPDDHPIFDQFSLFPADERGYFEDLVARQPDARTLRRGPAGHRDRDRLIGLALRYSETRHRFGLVDADFEERLVAARRSFARLLPLKYREKIEFYDPDRLTAAASLEENVLFGRIMQGEAGAEARVRALVRRVLAERGLEPHVYRLGLATRVEVAAAGQRAMAGREPLGARERVAIDLARCLVRRPDILVMGLGLDDRDRIQALRGLRKELGLIVCLPDAASLDSLAPFDRVLTVERNTVASVPEMSPAEPEPAV